MLVLPADFPIPHTHTHTLGSVAGGVCWKVGECVSVARAARELSCLQSHTYHVLFVLLWQSLFPFLFSCTWFSSPLSGIKCPSAHPRGLNVGFLCDLCRCPYSAALNSAVHFIFWTKKELILALKVEHSVFRMHMLLSAYTEFVQFVHFNCWHWKKGKMLRRYSLKKDCWSTFYVFLFKMWRSVNAMCYLPFLCN